MTVTCLVCRKSFTRCHGKFPKYCSIGCGRKSTDDVATRLAKKAKLAKSGCIEWTASLSTSGGYGQISIDGRPRRAHRVAYELAHGQIPRDMQICHRCDNPKCINVKHLFLGSNTDNIKDMLNKGRNSHGDSHYRAKLTRKKVMQMRHRRSNGETYRRLADTFSVSLSATYNAINGKTWR